MCYNISQATTGDLPSLTREPLDFEDHINQILEELSNKFREKYTRGQIEHGGRLWKKNTDTFLEEEILDFISYTYTRKYQLSLVKNLLYQALAMENWDGVRWAINVLEVGNAEGEREEEK